MTIDRGSDRSVTRQIADLIRADITAGRLSPGEPIPSEATLMQTHGVARATARAAAAILRAEGVVKTVPGRATFVAGEDVREVVTVPPGTRIAARNATDRERRAGSDAPKLVVTTEADRTEYPADEVEIQTTE